MKTMISQFKNRWNVVLFLLVLLSSASAFSTDTTKYKTRYVIVMVMDGPRWTETWGDTTHQYIPHMANDMAPLGIVSTAFRNNGPTYTNAGHTAITTGIYQNIKNNGLEFPKNPSMFQYWLKATSKQRNAAYVIASKDKLAILTDCKNKKWKGKYRPYSDCGVNGLYTGYRGDDVTFKNSIRILDTEHPELVLINFQQPDSWGHGNNWEKYLNATKLSDNYIYMVFEFLRTNEFYKDKTTIFVTNDHGRHLDGHKDGFVSHGDNCEGCRHINFFAYGPDFKSNVILDTPAELIDIPVTIGELMGFTIDGSEGRVMTELFK
ncbi:MAG: sulfatase-like hydrolase/transferase [Crocinitomicaceae bacterium]|nr:sulfatase-like hydrolase/transferase [Crocinitomicaceae bacterium]MBK8927211.1 sulfatase-like hydrolase/transferase [Crocinitomicaceae bacterium]